MLSVRSRAVPADTFRVGVALAGAVDGINTIFTAPETFVQTASGFQIAVYYNGQRLVVVDDYTVSGGGAGEGTTLTLLFAPKAGDKLTADYIAA
jgi:hypothetical protein